MDFYNQDWSHFFLVFLMVIVFLLILRRQSPKSKKSGNVPGSREDIPLAFQSSVNSRNALPDEGSIEVVGEEDRDGMHFILISGRDTLHRDSDP